MNEIDLHFFIESTENYFEEITGERGSAGIPYLKASDPVVLDYTGVIGITGKRRGSIYITTRESLLAELGMYILGPTDLGKVALKDLAGEIANTIAGNVRKAYGSSFLISVPVVVEGRPRGIRLPDDIPSFVVPVRWKTHQAFLVVCLE